MTGCVFLFLAAYLAGWAALGPFLSFDLGGGHGGLSALFTHLGPNLEVTWEPFGNPTLVDGTVELLVEQADRLYELTAAAFDADRDRVELGILHALAPVRGDGS